MPQQDALNHTTTGQLPRLQPRPAASPSTTTAAGATSQINSNSRGHGLPRRGPKAAHAACESCRRLKIGCTAERPGCSACVRRGVECRYGVASAGETRYQALRRLRNASTANEAALQQLIDLIGNSSEDYAHHIVRQIRHGVPVASILQQTNQSAPVTGEGNINAVTRQHHDVQHHDAQHQTAATAHSQLLDLLRNLPEQEAQDVLRRLRHSTDDAATLVNHVKGGNLLLQMAVAPETRFRYNFPYKAEMPLEFNTPDNPYLGSLVYEAASLYSSLTPSDPRHRHPLPNRSETKRPDEYHNIYLKPFHAASVVDPRLSDVKVSAWTAVCDDDMLMRDLIGVWLRCEYQFIAAFQKDYLLDDMANGRTDFCSSLLVNIILAYSCACYPSFSNRAEYWNPHTLKYRFFAEARRIWELEALEPRLTTIQSGILFSVVYNLCGLDEIGKPYRIQAVALAHRLRLFERAAHEPTGKMHDAKAYLAWALFNWETLIAFSFAHAPSVKTPPDWPLPDPSQNADFYGETWLKYPLSHALSPSYFGHMFKARSLFRILMNEACESAYAEGPGITPDKAYELYSRLKSWYDDLPTPLLPRTIVLPAQLQLHIYYHYLILAIFEPLCDDSNTHHCPPPRAIVAQSRKHLQTLIRLYYVRHSFDAMDLFIVVPLMLVASDCIEAIDEHTPPSQLETMRSTLILAAKGLHSQRKNHYLAEALFRVVRGRMRPPEVALLRDTMTQEEVGADEKRDMTQMVRSLWPVSVLKKKEDLESQNLTNLVENYAHLNVDETQK